jgi:hypothetical protein
MGRFPCRLHLYHTRLNRAPIRATDAPASSPGSADDVVAHAEYAVVAAWLRTLRRECEHTRAELQAASARCDVSRRNLAAALLQRDSEAIPMAYVDLEDRLVGARIAARAYRQALDALDRELELAYRQAGGEYFFDERIGREWIPGKLDACPSVRRPRRTARALLALGWLSQHVLSALVCSARRL